MRWASVLGWLRRMVPGSAFGSEPDTTERDRRVEESLKSGDEAVNQWHASLRARRIETIEGAWGRDAH